MERRYYRIIVIAAFSFAMYAIYSHIDVTWLSNGHLNIFTQLNIYDRGSDSLMDEEWMRSRSLIYKERRNRVEGVCAEHPELWVAKKPGNEVMVDVNNGLGYCRHGKVSKGRARKDFVKFFFISGWDNNLDESLFHNFKIGAKS